jgi:hypothetical protein
MAMTVSGQGCVETALRIFEPNGPDGSIAPLCLAVAERGTASSIRGVFG